jgi:hypothetical protein
MLKNFEQNKKRKAFFSFLADNNIAGLVIMHYNNVIIRGAILLP